MSDSQGNENVELDPTLDFLAGTAAGVSGLVVGFPFDTVKYRFQNPAPNVQYRSTFHALATITREERLRGLFKGISSPLASAPVLNGLLFATYRFLLKVQVPPDGQQEPMPSLAQIFLAGAGCGLASTLLTTPIELIKTQQQKRQQRLSADGRARVASARTVAAHIFRAGGVRALYRGLSATILRDVGGFGMYFYGYEATLRVCAPGDVLQETLALAHRSWAALLLAGGAAGVLGWVVTFPFDVLKTRMQAHIPLSRTRMADGTWSTARAMYAESGSRVFWRGLAPTLVRAVPVNMAVFGTFEGIVWAFS
ncbi:mitochondrial carrier domain-containing protein [Lactarius quietus]|nr:mitochondrial carrier domain-containing protein [Lactarius quietus]